MPMFWSTPAAGQREREYLFIDGGCLRAEVRRICEVHFGDPDAYRPLFSMFGNGGFDKVFYYDAVPGRAHDEAQAAYEDRVKPDYERFAQIQALDRFHVALGYLAGKTKRQKGVDVRLTVDMMTQAFRGNISKARLFAGDADFIPLVKALVSEGLHITLWHPPQANAELKGSADTVLPFDFKNNWNYFTSDGVNSVFSKGFQGGQGVDLPMKSGVNTIQTIGNWNYAGLWRNNDLVLWRAEHAGEWMTAGLSGPSLQHTLKAFNLMFEWGIEEDVPSWIEG